MPEKFEDIFSQEELKSLLSVAIHAWNPTLPRRWLNQHGHLYDNARRSCPLYAHYCALRTQALNKSYRTPIHHAQNWPANGLPVAL